MKRVHHISETQVLTEDCDPRSGEFFIGIADLNDPRPQKLHRFPEYMLRLIAWMVGAGLAVVLGLLLEVLWWRIF